MRKCVCASDTNPFPLPIVRIRLFQEAPKIKQCWHGTGLKHVKSNIFGQPIKNLRIHICASNICVASFVHIHLCSDICACTFANGHMRSVICACTFCRRTFADLFNRLKMSLPIPALVATTSLATANGAIMVKQGGGNLDHCLLEIRFSTSIREMPIRLK